MPEILDLSKVAERDTIKLPGGAARELIKNTDLGLYEYGQLVALQRRTESLTAEFNKGKSTAAKEKKLLTALGDLVRFLIPAITSAELAKLSRANREQIIITWIARNVEQGGDEGNARSPRTGGSSSRVSKSSTGATRKRGSTSRATR